MSIPATLKERYRIGQRIGQGGMGDVYRAYDAVLETDAAVKVLGANASRQALDLFDREWRALRDLHHGNIVSIYDRGEFPDGNITRPYFVMPFLNGRTLYEIIHDPATRLSVAEVVAIMCKVCEGIAAAHSHGIIHRDIKPGNIFVLQSGAVQIIDFGVAHLSVDTTLTTIKGTTPYIAPELLDPDDRRQPSERTDLFSLAVVCYEALTRIQPFERQTLKDTIRAILRDVPKPACDCNPEVSVTLSQVVQKCMAKSDSSRYASVAEFAEKLQKALRNEPLPEFDRSAIELRLRAITDLMSRGKVDSADSMLRSIEAEGYSDAAISALRLRIEKTLEQRTVEHLLETVNSQREAGQYLDALSTLDRVLQTVPDNVNALAQKAQIESDWIQTCIASAHQSSTQRDYARARKVLQDAQRLRPRDTQLIEMLAAVSRAEEHELNVRKEKESLYQEAQKAFRDTAINTALEKLGRIRLLQQETNAAVSDRDLLYEQFLREVQAEDGRIRSAYAEIQAHVGAHKYAQALAVCDQMLVTLPEYPLFKAARLDIENREREVRLDYIREVCARTESIVDLEVRVTLLQDALAKYPTESQLQELLRNAKSKRDVINSAVAHARKYEERGDFAEALERWKLVREFHPLSVGVDAEIERAGRRHEDQLRSERKGIALRRIDQLLEDAAYDKAREACDALLREFPNDKQIVSRLDVARESAVHAREAEGLFETGQLLLTQKRVDEAVVALRRAYELDGRRESIRQNLSAALVEKVRMMGEDDWEAADPLIREAVRLQPNDVSARSLATVIADRKERALVDQACVTAFKLSNNPEAALEAIDEILVTYPANGRLLEQREKILKTLGREEQARATTVGGRVVTPHPREPAAAPEPKPEGSPTPLSGLTDALSPETLTTVPRDVPAPPRRVSQWETVLNHGRKALDQTRVVAADALRAMSPYMTRLEQTTGNLLRRASVPLKPRTALVGVSAFMAVVLIVAVFATRSKGGSSTAAAPAPAVVPAVYSVTILAAPASAQLFVDGKAISVMPVELSGGPHRFEARQPGFRSAVEERDIKASSNISLQLQPLPARFRLAAGSDAKIRHNGEDRGSVAGGEFSSDDLQPGEHIIEVAGPPGITASIAFQHEPGRLPALSRPPTVRASAMLVAASFSGTAVVTSTYRAARLTVDGQAAGQFTEGALQLPLSPGEHEIAIENEPASRLKVTVSDEPLVSASVWWAQPKRPIEERYRQAVELERQEKYEYAVVILDGILRENPQHGPSRQLREKCARIVEALKSVGRP